MFLSLLIFSLINISPLSALSFVIVTFLYMYGVVNMKVHARTDFDVGLLIIRHLSKAER